MNGVISQLYISMSIFHHHLCKRITMRQWMIFCVLQTILIKHYKTRLSFIRWQNKKKCIKCTNTLKFGQYKKNLIDFYFCLFKVLSTKYVKFTKLNFFHGWPKVVHKKNFWWYFFSDFWPKNVSRKKFYNRFFPNVWQKVFW